MRSKLSENLVLSSGKYVEEEEYWLKQLKGRPQLSGLPPQGIRVSLSKFRSERITRDFPIKVDHRLKSMAGQSPYAMYMILLAGIQYLIHRYTGEKDMLVGMPIFKQQKASDSLNRIVAIRHSSALCTSFKDLLISLRSVIQEASKNQNYPYERLAKKLHLPLGDDLIPMFQTIVALDAIHDISMIEAIKPDVLFSFTTERDFLQLNLIYNEHLYTKRFIEQVADHAMNIFAEAVFHMDVPLADFDIFSEEEKQILLNVNQLNTEYPFHQSISELFEAQVSRTPSHIAVVCEGRQITYKELNERANQVAWHLRRYGVGEDSVVGVMMESSFELIIGILGILKAGAAYVPIDTTYPQDRIHYLMQHAECAVVLTKDRLHFDLPAKTRIVPVKEMLESESSVPVDNITLTYNPDRLMYVLYTSGSTGRPKGVMIKSHAFVNLMHWYTHEFTFSESDCVLLIASISFDLAQKNLYAPLLTGGRLCLFPAGVNDYAGISETIEREQVTVINCAPSLIYPLIDLHAPEEDQKDLGHHFSCLRSVNRLFLGGEPINLLKLRPWTTSPSFCAEIINTYGPTECTDVSSYYRLTRQDVSHGTNVPIGSSVYNTQLYVLDENLQVLPLGMVGELYIGGVGLARGYYRAKEQTMEKFLDSPHLPSAKIYKTGDLVRWLPDGNLSYIGRIDHQVKVNGIRIETGEIEARLLEMQGIEEAVVIAHENEQTSSLAAYYVAKHPISMDAVRKALAAHLPNYMIPSFYIQLNKLPLTPNGKIDRSALPQPDREVYQETAIVLPQSEIENHILDIWKEVLQRDRISVEDSYIQLGGHSLQAIMIISRLYKKHHIPLTLREFFDHQTIRSMARYIEEIRSKNKYSPIVPLKLIGNKTPIFFVHPIGGSAMSYLELVQWLDQDRPFYGLQSPGLDGGPLHNSVEEMASIYVAAIREIQKSGPYWLGGWSFGGVIALEMALQLQSAGEEVLGVTMIDSGLPPIESPASEAMQLEAFVYDLLSGRGFDEQDQKMLQGPQALQAKLQYIRERAFSLEMIPEEFTDEHITRIFSVFQANSNAFHQYELKEYFVDVQFFRGMFGPSVRSTYGWEKVVKNSFQVIEMQCNHFDILKPPFARLIADSISFSPKELY